MENLILRFKLDASTYRGRHCKTLNEVAYQLIVLQLYKMRKNKTLFILHFCSCSIFCIVFSYKYVLLWH